MIAFADRPTSVDYLKASSYIASTDVEHLHPSLKPIRQQVAGRLREMANVPDDPDYRRAYQTLRLLVW